MSSTILDFFHADSGGGGGGNGRIYGVKFDGTNSVGTRLLAAKNLNFSPSNTTTTGVDDFITIENSPFHIRECITDYSELTNKQRILAYEGDSNWNQLVEAKVGNRMIEFPKFWYKRPSKWEWYVSSEPFSGALPSPMHYRNGVMHDYVYVAKYMANSEYKSQSGQNILSHTPLSTFRTEYRKQGLYVWDYALHCSINMLLFIKYGNMNVQKFLGQGISMTTSHRVNTGLADNILGKDGYSGNTIAEDSSVLCMGIENYYGNLWHSLDGVFKNGSRLYINTDIESITSNPSSSSHNGYTVCPTSFFSPSISGNYWITDIAYDSQFPWMMFPTNGTWVANQNTLVEPEGLMIGDTYSSEDNSSDFHITIGGRYTNGYTCGLLGIGANMGMDFYSNEDDVISFCSFFLSEDVAPDTNTKIYGVKFENSVNGTRLEDSVGMQFSPSIATSLNRDDFYADTGSPYTIRECITDYNSITNRQEVLAYEGDSNWDQLVAENTYSSSNTSPIHERMIEFPKFYYKRPSKWEFYVSSYPHDTFLPSPMHYRNGKMHDYVYISKYVVDTNYRSCSGTQAGHKLSSGYDGDYTLSYFRNNLRSKGMYVQDYTCYCSLIILMMIKYASLEPDIIIGYGPYYDYDNSSKWTVGGSDGITGSCGRLSSGVSSYNTIKALGLENFYAPLGWRILDGGYITNGNRLFINTNIESIDHDPTVGEAGYIETNSIPSSVTTIDSLYLTDINFDQNYPFLLNPTAVTGDRNQAITGDVIFTGNLNGVYAIWTNAASYYTYDSRGLFNFHFRGLMDFSDMDEVCSSMFFSESYT